MEEELRSRLAEAPSRGLDLVQHTGGRVETSWGAVPVGVLADAAGVSGNHLALRRRFPSERDFPPDAGPMPDD